jgi:hypothetical protein
MIFFLNRGLILEREIVKALKSYFSITGVPEFYENFTVSVTNKHPFARMLLSETPEQEAASLFPAVIVAAESDSKPSELINLADFQYFALEPADINGAPGASDIEQRYMMMTAKKMSELRTAMDARTDKRLFGISCFIRRSDHISIEIWSENNQLKNELYELIRLFVCGFLHQYLEKVYQDFFKELGEGNSPLAIFDSSIQGQRSNNFNLDFGVELFGANITFDADYIIEQSVIDTEAVDGNIDVMEVINHVKEQAGTSTSVVFDYSGS